MSLNEIPALIDNTSQKYANFEYDFKLTDKVSNQSRDVKVQGTSYLACLTALENLCSSNIHIHQPKLK